MAMVWVRAGVCEKETTIAAQRSDMTRGHLGEHPAQRIAHLSPRDGTSLPQ